MPSLRAIQAVAVSVSVAVIAAEPYFGGRCIIEYRMIPALVSGVHGVWLFQQCSELSGSHFHDVQRQMRDD
jgi:hypothetical protein